MTVAQSLPGIDGVVVVTTPQDVALLDTRKAVNFAKALKLPCLGVIENMSGYRLSGNAEPSSSLRINGPTGVPIEIESDEDGNWEVILDLFKSGGGQSAAEELEVPFLGKLPFDPGVLRGGDDGVHRIIAEPEGESAKAFEEVVTNLSNQLTESASTEN